jgi:hypothetical protein
MPKVGSDGNGNGTTKATKKGRAPNGRGGYVVQYETQQSRPGRPNLGLPEIHSAYRLVADHLYRHGNLGKFAYAAFDFINATYFGGSLPETLILWDLTDYGHCLGWCRSSNDGPPIIKLHPNLVMGSSDPHQEERWHVPLELLGRCYAFDVLLHECIHACINYNLGGWERLDGPQRNKWTSHNNPLWVAECNRIAKLLGYPSTYTMKKYRRVGGEGSYVDKAGRKRKKRRGRLEYGCDGPDFERFPHEIPERKAFYRAEVLPFKW